MQVLRAKVVALCEALGFSTASKWNKMRMMSKLKEIAGLGDVGDDLEEQEHRDLLNLIVTQKGDVDVVQSLEQDPDAELSEEVAEAPAEAEEVREAEESVKTKAKAAKVEKVSEEEPEVKQPKVKKDKVQKESKVKDPVKIKAHGRPKVMGKYSAGPFIRWLGIQGLGFDAANVVLNGEGITHLKDNSVKWELKERRVGHDPSKVSEEDAEELSSKYVKEFKSARESGKRD